MKPFHLSIGSNSIETSIYFFTEVLPGSVVHRDQSGYVNIEIFCAQITLKDSPSISTEIPDFHFGFNLSLSEFDNLAAKIMNQNKEFVALEPKTVDPGTSRERKKMFLKSPSGYLVELKGYK